MCLLQYKCQNNALELEQQINNLGQQVCARSSVTRLVPPFREDDVNQYLIHFENVASNLRVAQRMLDNIITDCVHG